ncbi:Hypothetical protein, putative [Bodo saltans]|uniref:Uncharacterized protein n=1 Tax=Bodo saltans TaxID=75058 RepID=A0A0S4JNT3_BODSA|nr:Hypothetical protein, putative [Bodo saltans]|eukprot:CUG90781.1 Hypothetical protein, putative [Bodo saltans]
MSSEASKNRCLLQVAPPERRVVRRNASLSTPLRQVVLLMPRNVVPEDVIRLTPSSKRDRDGYAKSSGDEPLRVAVFVWPDSTIRELLEAAMHQHPKVTATWLEGAAMDKTKIKVCHVFPGADRKPAINSFATLKLNGPIEAKDDLITFSELAEKHFKAGDLIVFSRV